MPLHSDFTKLRRAMRKQYGKEKGDEVFWGYVNKHKLDETKPMNQQNKVDGSASADLIPMLDDDLDEGIDDMLDSNADLGQMGDNPAVMPQPTPVGDPTKPQGLGADTDRPITIAPGSTALNDAPDKEVAKEIPLNDQMNRRDQELPSAEAGAETVEEGKGHEQKMGYKKQEVQPPYQKGVEEPEESIGGGDDDPHARDTIRDVTAAQFVSIPAYRMEYVAAPKFQGDDAPLLIKAIVLEEGHNINNWRVVPNEFQKVADQYKAGRQLRVNHDKTVESVIGRSYDGRVIKGTDIRQYLGREIAGIDPDAQYVVAEFEANPKDLQIRQNILAGYVVTGSIGLDAEASCEECGQPLKAGAEGKMEHTCRHFDAPVKLTNVEVKEYSYVAEPAFEHTQAFPTFSAAVDSIRQESSLSASPTKENQMPTPVSAVAKAEGKKAESEGDADADAEAKAEALAAKLMAAYERGLKAGGKFRADAEGEGEGKAEAKADAEGEGEGKAEAKAESEGEGEADASAESESEADAGVSSPPPLPGQKPKVPAQFSRKGDQITKVSSKGSSTPKVTMMDKIWNPTAAALSERPYLRELFRAAAEAPGAPAEVRNKIKGYFEG